MTENTALAFFSVLGEPEDKIDNSVGKLQDHLEVKVVDTEGRIVPMGVTGDLYMRGYSTMLGYYGDAEATAKTIGVDNWLNTG